MTQVGLPACVWVYWEAGRTRPGGTLRKGFIGQYRFCVKQIRSHNKREILEGETFVRSFI